MIFTSGRLSFLAISGRTMTSAPPPSLMTQQSSRIVGHRVGVTVIVGRAVAEKLAGGNRAADVLLDVGQRLERAGVGRQRRVGNKGAAR
ncbi:MAG: hypothetical protein ACLQFW_17795, partial [Xanthobacteraceae bacterium]